MRHHLVRLVALAVLSAAFLGSSASADTVYRCARDGKVTYTNVPCDGGEVVTATGKDNPANAQAAPLAAERTKRPLPLAAARAPMVTTLDRLTAKCNRGERDACTAVKAIRADEQEHAALVTLCGSGVARACDQMACAERGDTLACARLDGKETGTGWMEVARTKQPVKNPARPTGGPARVPTEMVVTIACVGTGQQHDVYVRADLGLVASRDGEPAVGPDGKVERLYGTTYYSLKEAGDTLCR